MLRSGGSTTFLALMAVFATVGGMLLLDDGAEAVDYGAVLTPKDPTLVRFTEPGGEAWFNWTLTNTYVYGANENVTADVLGQPFNWQHFLAASTVKGVRTSTNRLMLDLSIHETANLSLTMTPPMNAPNGTYWMTLSVTVDEDPSVNYSQRFCVVIGTLEPWFGLAKSPINGRFSVIPPAKLSLRFVLFNDGSTADRFHIAYNTSKWEEGWVIGTNPSNQQIDELGWTSELPVDPARSHPFYFDLFMIIPAEAPGDLLCKCDVSAMSEAGQTTEAMTVSFEVATLQFYDFQVYIDGSDARAGLPGEQVEFQLRIHNRGNGPDVFTIEPAWDEDLNPGFAAFAIPHTIVIASNETGLVSYVVRVPEAAPKKVYFFTAEIHSSSHDLAMATKTLGVEVGQFFALELSSPDVNASTDPGGVLEFEVFVKNVGNGLDSIKLHLEGVPSKWINYTQPDEHSLLQNEEGRSTIRIIVPSQFDEAPIGSYNITVVANSARSSASARFDIRIDITQFYRVDWMYLDDPITADEAPMAQSNIIKPRRTVNPYERNYIDIPLEIKNFGNGEDNLEVWGWAVNDRVTVVVAPTTTLLKRDETRLIKVRIEVPQDLPPGVYSLFVNATSQDRTTKVKIVPLDFEVFNIDGRVPPIPTYIDPVQGDTVRSEISVDVGANMSFKIRIENNGTKAMSGVLLRVYDVFLDKQGNLVRWNFFNFTTTPIAVGDKFTVGERPHTAQNPSISWWANVTGQHTMEFRIFYDYQSVAANDISSVNITVKELKDEATVLEQFGFIGLIVAVAVAVIIAIAYVFVLRRKPEVDKDLYSSIYGGEFEEPMALEGEAAPAADAGPQLTAEQQALYGDDYGTGGEEGAYDEGEYDDEAYEDEVQK
jgi:uncharacterized membrane protein